jgi:hypothetical protein
VDSSNEKHSPPTPSLSHEDAKKRGLCGMRYYEYMEKTGRKAFKTVTVSALLLKID